MGRKKKAATKGFGSRKNFNRGSYGEGYDLTARDNELFVKYYKGQGIVPDGEWDEFYETLKRTLPVTFRITGSKSQSAELLQNIKGKFFSGLLNVQVEDQMVPPPKCLPWYPSELAWQMDLTRKMVRSSEAFSQLHDFLVAETECGAISRQEAVSMIPPLVLDIKSHHKILDMCASPGSKTAQLIEYLHSTANEGELPTGYVVANDVDNKRCYLMVHQVKRLQSPCCLIVNHDGSVFPKFRSSSDDSNPQFELFDRILCDVPCSGDGTMRKNFDVWGKWHPLQGANMHGLQLKILRRSCQLLELGGRLVYSTCSLNPAEDEAVIAEMLRSSEGALELVDISDKLPGLKYVKGLSNWKVMTKTGEWIPSKEEIPAPLQTQYKKTIFPPTPEEAERFHLDKCIRILPHQQDSGGFFIAALQKVRHLPGSREARLQAEVLHKTENADIAPSEEASVKKEEGSEPSAGEKRTALEAGEEPKPKKTRLHGYKEDPFFFMEPSDPIWPSIKDFFGLSDEFPVEQIMFRSLQGKRTLYFVSKSVKNLVSCNENRVKFINMGVKAFSRSPSPIVPDCDFRMAQECLSTLLPCVSKRKVNVNKEDAIIIISQENPFIAKLSYDTQQQLKNLSAGSTVFAFSPSEKEPSPSCDVVFCGWRGKTSVRCFGSRCDRSHGLMLLGEDLKEINKRVEEEKQAKLAKKQEDGVNTESTDHQEDVKRENEEIESICKSNVLDEEETKESEEQERGDPQNT